MLNIIQIPVLIDNYIYLLIDKGTSKCACVDPALSQPVIDVLNKLNLRPYARARLRGGTSPRADDATRLSAKREANPRLNPLTVVHHTIVGADLE